MTSVKNARWIENTFATKQNFTLQFFLNCFQFLFLELKINLSSYRLHFTYAYFYIYKSHSHFILKIFFPFYQFSLSICVSTRKLILLRRRRKRSERRFFSCFIENQSNKLIHKKCKCVIVNRFDSVATEGADQEPQLFCGLTFNTIFF